MVKSLVTPLKVETTIDIVRIIGYIIAALFVVLLITICICYSQRKCCFRNCGRQSQNPTHTIPSPNQTVTTVTGNPSQPFTTYNTQPMSSNYPTQAYPAYPAQPQVQPSYQASPPGYNQYQNYDKQPATNPGYNPDFFLLLRLNRNKYSAYGANFGQPNNQYIPPAGSVRY